MSDNQYILELLMQTSQRMGAAIMPYARKEKGLNIRKKEDGTKITDADIAANEVAMKFLSENASDIYVISEEDPATWSSASYEMRRRDEDVILLDPLDGSRNIEKGNEFCTMIAYVRGDTPIVGVIHHPPTNIYYYGCEDGSFMFEVGEKERRLTRSPQPSDLNKVIFGHSSGQKREKYVNLFAALGIDMNEENNPKLRLSGSGGLRAIQVLTGETDAILAYTKSFKEWDSAAYDAIASQMGVSVTDIFGKKLTYNKKETVHPNGVLVSAWNVSSALVEFLTEYNKTVPM
ncbi:MAG: inositol monophosphatase family protein [Candidatus Aenigmatarchaeota archaeon]